MNRPINTAASKHHLVGGIDDGIRQRRDVILNDLDHLQLSFHLRNVITRLTINSFSCGFDSAIITVSATSVWSAMRFVPSLRRSSLLRFRK